MRILPGTPYNKQQRAAFFLAAITAALLLLAGCARAFQQNAAWHNDPQADDGRTEELTGILSTLAAPAARQEAALLARTAIDYSRQLAEKYRVFASPHLHNILVNTGFREKGLCYQWADELLTHLKSLELRSFDLHEAAAGQGTWREHNAVVVTGKGGNFAEGIVLDAWRQGGRLYWIPVQDDTYQWLPRKLVVR